MNIKQAKEEIRHTIKAYLSKNSHGEYEIPPMRQRPILLMGPPGIGKTQIMEQVARECRIGLVSYTITHHTRQSAIGLPFIEEKEYGGRKKHVTEYTMSEIVASIYDKMEETGLKEGLLFIDEINCVSETLAPAMLQFLQYKTFGNHRIPDGWIIVSAGNPPEYNKSVRDFDIATLDRVRKIDVEADFEVWREYAKTAGIHPAILSYLKARPQNFYRVETTVDGKCFATPRGWEDLSVLLCVYEKEGIPCGRDVISQYIQNAGIAKDFANYLELCEKYQSGYRINEILSGKRDERLMEQAARAAFDERLSVIGLILSRLNAEFRETGKKEEYLELLYGQLKGYREQITAPAFQEAACRDEETSLPLFQSALEGLRKEYENQKRAGLLTRGEQYRYQDVLETMNRYLLEAKAHSLTDGKEAFSLFAQSFGAEREACGEQCAKALRMLEYAFDFMEGAFGDSQEMVSFITELNTSVYAVKFLEENPCERYFQYNRRLLFEDRESEITGRLNRLGVF